MRSAGFGRLSLGKCMESARFKNDRLPGNEPMSEGELQAALIPAFSRGEKENAHRGFRKVGPRKVHGKRSVQK